MSPIRSLRSVSVSIVCVSLALGLCSACGAPGHGAKDMARADDVQINQMPTGSIQTPSLCERTTLDQRITMKGADSFAFTWVDDHYQVVYEDHATQDIFAVKLSREGLIQGAAVAVEQTASKSSLPTILRTRGGFVVAWQEEDVPAVRTHGLTLDGLPTGDGQQIAVARSSQMRPVLADSPGGIAISWMDQTAASSKNNDTLGTSSAYLGLLDGNYALRTDVPARPLGTGGEAGYPWLAGSSTALEVLYSATTTQTDVFVSPITADTSTLTIGAANDIRDPSAANQALLGRLTRTDFGYLASWEDHRSGEAEIYLGVLDATGKRYAGGLVEEPATGNANWSHQAWTGSAAGIVYYQYRSGRPQIFMTFIDQTGARIGGAADMQVSNTPASARFPSVQWDGSQFGVLWIDSRSSPVELYFNSAVCKKSAPI